MTELQKRIQKSSYYVVLVLYFMTLSPLSGIWSSFLKLRMDPPQFRAYHMAMLIIHLLTLICVILAQRIFRDIHEQYTPFQSIHVRRLRIVAALSLLCAICSVLLAGWKDALNFGHTVSFLIRTLNYFQISDLAVPVAAYSLSFILDYACRLQAEADTTL